MKSRLPAGYGGGAGNQQQMLKKYQQMQEQIEETQAELDETEFSQTAGGGVVKATVNGKKQVLALDIDPDIIDRDDPETLSDLVISAINAALLQAEKTSEEKLSAITGGLGF